MSRESAGKTRAADSRQFHGRGDNDDDGDDDDGCLVIVVASLHCWFSMTAHFVAIAAVAAGVLQLQMSIQLTARNIDIDRTTDGYLLVFFSM
jgi:hypothetical protein